MKIDENDELACWAIICRQPYKDRMGECVKDIVQKYWLEHARVSPNSRDVIRQILSQNVYEICPKHIMEMTQVQLFNKFKHDHRGINMSITTFLQQKPWYVRPITIRDTCGCHYHVQFKLYYDMFLEFGKMFWTNSPPPPIVREFISQTLCEEIPMKYFIIRNVSMENNVMVVEILFYSTINTLSIMISRFQM